MPLRSLIVLVGLLASCAAPSLAPPQRQGPPPVRPELEVYGRQVSFGAGVRAFGDEDFGALDDQVAWTLDYCEPMDLGALRLEGGMHYSYDDASATSAGQTVHLRSRSFELSVGVNFSHLISRLRPYVGIGASLLFLQMRGLDEDADLLFDDNEVTAGGYAKAGLLFQVSRT
jgi:hypothetical protein